MTVGPGCVVRNLVLEYENFRLGPLSFELRPGERVALIGRNGAGKSTTLRILSGRETEYLGSVLLGGDEVAGAVPEIRTRVGLLPERLLGYPWMTVAQHFAFLSQMYPEWESAYADELAEALDVPLTSKLGTLSKGTQVKVSLVAAEAYRPPLLILDEPTSGIDPIMRRDLLSLITTCVPEGGERILLFSSHLLEDVEFVADRVLFIAEGALVADHRVEDVRAAHPDRPLSTALQEVLGAYA